MSTCSIGRLTTTPTNGPTGGLVGVVLEPEPGGLDFVGTGFVRLAITIDHD